MLATEMVTFCVIKMNRFSAPFGDDVQSALSRYITVVSFL